MHQKCSFQFDIQMNEKLSLLCTIKQKYNKNIRKYILDTGINICTTYIWKYTWSHGQPLLRDSGSEHGMEYGNILFSQLFFWVVLCALFCSSCLKRKSIKRIRRNYVKRNSNIKGVVRGIAYTIVEDQD